MRLYHSEHILFDNVDMFNWASLSEPHASEFFHTISVVASFPGPAQLSITCSMEKRYPFPFDCFVHAWGEPGNKAISVVCSVY